MFLGLLRAGLFAGILTAVVYSFVQALTVTPLIFEAEFFEGQAAIHDRVHSEPGISNDEAHGHAVPPDGWEPEDGLERYGVTFLANLVTSIGFSLVLIAAIMVRGRPVNARIGLIWGIAGFFVFAFAPALGLPPEVPGAAAAPLEARQLWYAGTVSATAIGLGIVVFSRPFWARALVGPGLLLLPHLVGVPSPDLAEGAGPVPQEVAARYVVWSLATTLFFWALLGTLCGHFFGSLAANKHPEHQAA